MTWQLQYTHPVSTTADHHSFFVYFFDTYLNNKSQFTVTAHPDASAFKRSFSMTYPNPYNGGSNSTQYFWVNWQSTSPTFIYWYWDFTYTTVPGDLGTYTSGSTLCQWDSYFNSSGASNIKIWQSSERTDAILVTAGKRVLFFWPGCTELGITEPFSIGTWDGSSGLPGMGWIKPWVGAMQAMELYYSMNQSGASSSVYNVIPNFGFTYNYVNTKYPDGPTIMTGFAWDSGISYQTNQQSYPIMGAVTSDFGAYIPTPNVTGNGDDYWVCALATTEAELIFDTNTSKYWLVGYPNQIDSTCGAWDFGTSEPDFS